MADRISSAELRQLMRWQRRMIAVMVVTWSFVLLFIAVEVVFDLPRELEISGFAVMLLLVAVGVVIQFSERCPSCGKRIGWQSGVIVPESCGRCGVVFRPREGDRDG